MELALFGALLTLVSAPNKPAGMPELKRAIEIQTGGVELADKIKRYSAQKAKTTVPATNIVLGAVSLISTKRAKIRTGPLRIEVKRDKVELFVGFSW